MKIAAENGPIDPMLQVITDALYSKMGNDGLKLMQTFLSRINATLGTRREQRELPETLEETGKRCCYYESLEQEIKNVFGWRNKKPTYGEIKDRADMHIKIELTMYRMYIPILMLYKKKLISDAVKESWRRRFSTVMSGPMEIDVKEMRTKLIEFNQEVENYVWSIGKRELASLLEQS